MKRNLIGYLMIVGMCLAAAAVGAAAQTTANSNESLGAYARTVRADKKPDTSKHFDNDNLPRTETLSVVGNVDGATATNPDGPASAANSTSDSTASSDGKQQPSSDDFKSQIADAQGKVDLLSRELDVAQKEYQLRAAAFYGDAGNRLRNASSWDKEDAAYKEQIAAKQKDLDAAKHDLADIQEQARKASMEHTK
ncbi:MAG TPA: hypothetical protein VN684_03585 [Terriglobales bacterium]|nr:hypothetical protein [Terriglobales bacterium]